MASIKMQEHLIDLWRDIFICRHCNLPDDYTPQFHPLGNLYQENGILFAQINPGHIGRLTDTEIKQRYKNESSRQKARYKKEITSELLSLQNSFSKSPSSQNLKLLNTGYLKAVNIVWGWPPGKYSKTIEKHGVNIDKVALINLAQCPVPKDKYTKQHFSNCWQLHTKRLLEILKPKLIVAQGKASLNFLQKQDLESGIALVEGNHHASRQSNEVKNHIFNNVKTLVEQLSA